VEAGLEWDENANVCSSSTLQVSHQPLTKSECIATRSTWDENANVCDWEPLIKAETAASVLITIDKSKQRMTVLLNGVQQ
jgi:hypothetical protein